jgi:type III pantothenate kinase
VLLLLEVGNTNTSVGVHDGARLIASWRLTSRREQTSDEYGLFIHTLLRSRGIEPRQISDVAISNVVPPVQRTLERMAEGYFGVTPFSVQSGVNVPITLVVDFGTATNFDCVNARGEFIGGAIAPGLATAAEALISRAARLYRVELVAPATAVGRNTATNIQSGAVLGYAGLVDGLIERMRREIEGDVKVIGTGGLAAQMREVARSIQIVNPDLRLEGLRLIWKHGRTG